MMDYILIILCVVLSYLLTYFIRVIAIKKNIIDIPNKRSSHSVPTPRGGGLSFFILWLVVVCLFFLTDQITKDLFLALLCIIPIGLISFIDDYKSVSPKIRLFIQVASSSLAIYFLGGVQFLSIGSINILAVIPLSILAIIGLVWFTNLFNFLDGIDAYASTEAILITLGLFFVTQDLILVYFIATIAGFLFWNWPKAKIFMGDVGSTMLGFTIFIFGVHYNNEGSVNIIYWISLTSLFWFDATVTLIRRKLNGENVSQPHKKHAYQRIVQAGFSHKKTVVSSLVINILLVAFVFLNVKYFNQQPYLSFIFSFTLNALVYTFVEKKYGFST